MSKEFKNSVAYLITMPKGMLRRSPEEIKAWREKEERKSKRKWHRKTALPVYLVLLIIPFCSCVTRKACERRFPPSRHDSVRIVTNTVTTYRDTTIYIKIKGDTVFKSISEGQGMSVLKTPFATSYASVKNGMLNHRLEQRDTVVTATIKNLHKTTLITNTTQHSSTKIARETKFTKWKWFQICLGRSFLLFFVLGSLFMVVRRFKG